MISRPPPQYADAPVKPRTNLLEWRSVRKNTLRGLVTSHAGHKHYAAFLGWRDQDLTDRFSAAVVEIVRASCPDASDDVRSMRSERNSPRAWLTICHPHKPSPPMIAAIITSGQPVPVPNTPMAASSTVALPTASLHEQDRAHVRVSRAEAVEHERYAAVGDRACDRHHAHDLGPVAACHRRACHAVLSST